MLMLTTRVLVAATTEAAATEEPTPAAEPVAEPAKTEDAAGE